MVHYVKRSVKPRHALKIDAAVEKPGPVQTTAEHGPIQPVFPVV